MSRAILLVPAVLLLALAACKKDGAAEQTAAGQVLPGSISDAMLPEDRVTSHPPLDPGADRSGGGAAGGTEAAPQGTNAPSMAETGAPAEAPKPAASGE